MFWDMWSAGEPYLHSSFVLWISWIHYITLSISIYYWHIYYDSEGFCSWTSKDQNSMEWALWLKNLTTKPTTGWFWPWSVFTIFWSVLGWFGLWLVWTLVCNRECRFWSAPETMDVGLHQWGQFMVHTRERQIVAHTEMRDDFCPYHCVGPPLWKNTSQLLDGFLKCSFYLILFCCQGKKKRGRQYLWKEPCCWWWWDSAQNALQGWLCPLAGVSIQIHFLAVDGDESIIILHY